jgi:hypothetical protein
MNFRCLQKCKSKYARIKTINWHLYMIHFGKIRRMRTLFQVCGIYFFPHRVLPAGRDSGVVHWAILVRHCCRWPVQSANKLTMRDTPKRYLTSLGDLDNISCLKDHILQDGEIVKRLRQLHVSVASCPYNFHQNTISYNSSISRLDSLLP